MTNDETPPLSWNGIWNAALRMVLMLVLFVLSIALVTAGWKMTGQLAGLGIMLLGVALLLAVLALYNAPYQD